MANSDSEDGDVRLLLEECVDKQFYIGSANEGNQKTTGTRGGNHIDQESGLNDGSSKIQQSVNKHKKNNVFSNLPSKRITKTSEEDYDDGVPAGTKLHFAKKLDDLIAKTYVFIEVGEENLPTDHILKTVEVNHDIIPYSVEQSQEKSKPEHVQHHKKRTNLAQKLSHIESLDKSDLSSVAVTGEWVLNKCGVYGNGREKQGELITGAVHGPTLRKLNG